jgi:hypothetical protein
LPYAVNELLYAVTQIPENKQNEDSANGDSIRKGDLHVGLSAGLYKKSDRKRGRKSGVDPFG